MPQQPYVYMDINTTVGNMGTELNQQRPIDMDIMTIVRNMGTEYNQQRPIDTQQGNQLSDISNLYMFRTK